MNFKDIINTSTTQLINSMRLCDIRVGIIYSIMPTTIKLENDKILPVDFFMFTSKTSALKYTEDDNDIDKKIVVIQQTGGQKYFVLDYIEE